MKHPLVVIAGPTATGKSKLAVSFAKAHNGSVISADSMQVYRGMDIGSAKVTEKEMEGVPHYLIDILDPREEFNVSRFCGLAKEALSDIYGQGRLPIVCGGTGFYIRALLYDADFSTGKENASLRKELEAFAKEQGEKALHERLSSIDEEAAAAIHPHNVKRVIRAIEFYQETGKKISEHNAAEHQKDSPYAFCYFVLTDERQKLYDGIDARVDVMIRAGLYEEVKRLCDAGLNQSYVSMQGLGYKEMIDVIEGRATMEEAIYKIKRDTRHFAKRQLTWFKRERDVIWVDKQAFSYNEERILDYLEQECIRRGLI